MRNVQIGIDSGFSENIHKFNAKAQENRDLVKSSIDMTLILGTQKLAFRWHNESSHNKVNFKVLAEFFTSNAENSAGFIKTSSVISGLYKTIQDGLIKYVSFVLEKFIDGEVHVYLARYMKQHIRHVSYSCLLFSAAHTKTRQCSGLWGFLMSVAGKQRIVYLIYPHITSKGNNYCTF